MEKVFDIPKNVVGPEKFLDPQIWYTDRIFFGDGGGGRGGGGWRSPKLICSTTNFFGTGRHNPKKLGKFLSAPLIFSFPYAHAKN